MGARYQREEKTPRLLEHHEPLLGPLELPDALGLDPGGGAEVPEACDVRLDRRLARGRAEPGPGLGRVGAADGAEQGDLSREGHGAPSTYQSPGSSSPGTNTPSVRSIVRDGSSFETSV